eukprot:12483897-Heterocapsa_arctica.AAC.1
MGPSRAPCISPSFPSWIPSCNLCGRSPSPVGGASRSGWPRTSLSWAFPATGTSLRVFLVRRRIAFRFAADWRPGWPQPAAVGLAQRPIPFCRSIASVPARLLFATFGPRVFPVHTPPSHSVAWKEVLRASATRSLIVSP